MSYMQARRTSHYGASQGAAWLNSRGNQASSGVVYQGGTFRRFSLDRASRWRRGLDLQRLELVVRNVGVDRPLETATIRLGSRLGFPSKWLSNNSI